MTRKALFLTDALIRVVILVLPIPSLSITVYLLHNRWRYSLLSVRVVTRSKPSDHLPAL